MFAANRIRGNFALQPVRASLRSNTGVYLLLAYLLPACSANRFNTSENAALSDDATSVDFADASVPQDASSSAAVDTLGNSTTDSDALDASTAMLTARETTSSDATSHGSLSGEETGHVSTSATSAAGGTSEPSSVLTSSTDQGTSFTHDVSDGSTLGSNSSGGSGTNFDSGVASTGVAGSSATTSETLSASHATTDEGALTMDLSESLTDAGADSSVGATFGTDATSTDGDASVTDTSQSDVGTTAIDSEPQSATTAAGSFGETSAPPVVCTVTRSLPGIVRDFTEDHPDMEPCDEVDCRSEKGLLQSTLGADGKPRLSDDHRADSTVRDAESFNQWFNDVEGVNVSVPFNLRISTQRYIPPRKIGFDSSDPPWGSPPGFGVSPKGFFPIDELNTTTRSHNYSFTYEVDSFIEYTGGETLTVRGDDDIFVFINRRLAIDLGGIHPPQEATVDLDELAEELGLEPGNVYDFRVFFAERHVEQSNLYLSTTARFMDCTGG